MGEEFQCQCESGNRFDLYAIASSHVLTVVKMLKFRTLNFCTEHNFYEIYEILHPMKISRYIMARVYKEREYLTTYNTVGKVT